MMTTQSGFLPPVRPKRLQELVDELSKNCRWFKTRDLPQEHLECSSPLPGNKLPASQRVRSSTKEGTPAVIHVIFSGPASSRGASGPTAADSPVFIVGKATSPACFFLFHADALTITAARKSPSLFFSFPQPSSRECFQRIPLWASASSDSHRPRPRSPRRAGSATTCRLAKLFHSPGRSSLHYSTIRPPQPGAPLTLLLQCLARLRKLDWPPQNT